MKSLLEHHGISKTQEEVDFIIPFFDLDRRYFLDPALMRFSPNAMLRRWSEEIDEFLKLIRQVLKSGNKAKFMSLLAIGEANDIGLGYCSDGTSGSGFGEEISANIQRIVSRNPEYKKTGFVRLEELQWLDRNIGPDRISDLAAHILKRELIKYTQKQCKTLGIEMELVRVSKVFHGDTLSWRSLETKLPVNPTVTVRDALNPHPPILLIPKRAVRPLPLFLNYDNLYGFLRADDAKLDDPEIRALHDTKGDIVEYMTKHPEQSKAYVKAREGEPEKLYRPDFDSGIQTDVEKLATMSTGQKNANEYRDTVGRIFGYLFEELELVQTEKKNILGDLQRDLVYANHAASGIFGDLKTRHKAGHIVVDAKNTDHVTPDDISRVADYLNDDIGRVGIIISRKSSTRKELARLRRHAYTQLKDQKKVILFVSDSELKSWVTDKTRLQHTTGKSAEFYDPRKSIGRKYTELASL